MASESDPKSGLGVSNEHKKNTTDEQSREMRHFRSEQYDGFEKQSGLYAPFIFKAPDGAELYFGPDQVHELVSRLLPLIEARMWKEKSTEKPSAPSSKKRRGTKGKDINGQMLKVLQGNCSAQDWTSAEWAEQLRCADSTVRGSKAWRNLSDANANTRRGRADKMDRPHDQ